MNALPARVRAFTAGSATSDGASMRAFYANLPIEGWLVELARTHGRALMSSWTHDEFAAWLGLRVDDLGKAYRQLLQRGDLDREELVQLARRLLLVAPTDGPTTSTLQRSPEMMRFRRAREIVERRERTKGRPCAPADTAGPLGEECERKRLELRVGLEDWSAALGLSMATYRNRLARERDPRYREKIVGLARDAATLYHKMALPVVARYDVVARAELAGAYDVVGADLARLRQTLLSEGEDLTVNDAATPIDEPDGFLKLDLYSWLRAPEEEENYA